MTERVFLDTNVLVYAFDTHPASAAKRESALRLLADDALTPCISTQVLGEFFVTVTRKLPQPLSASGAAAVIAELMHLPVVPTDAALVSAGIATAQSAQVSYWDALIIEAAVAAGCRRLLTEDLQHGGWVRGIRIGDPFREPGSSAP